MTGCNGHAGSVLPSIRIAECAFGRGLFAAETIVAGRTILEFTGPRLTLAEVRRKGALAANALQIGRNCYLDLEEPGRLANHSCRPNAGVFQGVRLAALCDIPAGNEIVFDYSTTIGDGWTMACRCETPTCRGVVAAFLLLPRRLQDEYIVRGCVADFFWQDLEC